jgi:hypothetical protein
MHAQEELPDRAEAEIKTAASRCRTENYAPTAVSDLWNLIKSWTEHPDFLTDTGSSLRGSVLNNITFLLADVRLREGAWSLVRDLAARFGEDDPTGMGISIKIFTFEIAAEPPEVDYMLDLLFSLADDPTTRWAVFAAYESYPWRLRPHARKYSKGTVSDEDCDSWLRSQGLEEDEYLITNRSGQDGADQPATAPESKPEGDPKHQPESEGRSQ